jgi:TonB family protein
MLYAPMIDFSQAITIAPTHQVQNTFNLSELISTGYWVIAVLLLLRFGWGILRIFELAKTYDYKLSGKLRLYPIQRKTTFSFFNYIFIQPEHWEKPSIDYIIHHEQAHVNNLHSLDNLLTELILVFGWFNPFFYIYRRELHLLHECQADQSVINSGYDKTTYHQLLMNEVSGNLTYIIVNQFSYSLIKRRFKMISKNQKSRLAGFRILLAIPTAFILLLMFSFTSVDKTTTLIKSKIIEPSLRVVQVSLSDLKMQQEKTAAKEAVKTTSKFTPPPVDQKDTTTKASGPIKLASNVQALDEIVVVGYGANSVPNENENIAAKPVMDRNPSFPGGFNAMLRFLGGNLTYPVEAQRAKIQGTVFVQFQVTKTGEIKNVKLLRGISKPCDDEALRVVDIMPKWTPALKEGVPVDMDFAIPIKFMLQMN